MVDEPTGAAPETDADEEHDWTVEGPHIADVAAARAHQQALAQRERDLAAEHAHRGAPAVRTVIQADRLDRWTTLLRAREERAGVRDWARRVTKRTGSATCLINGHELPWICALYVVRYGESEHYWPAELGEADVARATRWEFGKLPRWFALPTEEA